VNCALLRGTQLAREADQLQPLLGETPLHTHTLVAAHASTHASSVFVRCWLADIPPSALLLLLLLLTHCSCCCCSSAAADCSHTLQSKAQHSSVQHVTSAMSSELQRLSDPNYAISLAVGPPFPELKPQAPGSGLVLTNQCSSEPRRWARIDEIKSVSHHILDVTLHCMSHTHSS
jgi:hypothetical protein